MKNKQPETESTKDLVFVLKQIATLIEDNNQNIKDCYRIISRLEKNITPKQNNTILSGIKKLLNRQ